MLDSSNESARNAASKKIAVVGIACRLPGGVTGPDSYWQLLEDKKCGIREVPSDRWSVDHFYDSDPNALSRSQTKWAGFLDDVKSFDPGFFGLSPREATSMDPQQRNTLMTSYEAIEDSGIPWEEYQKARTGVFVGVQSVDYREVQEKRRSGFDAFGGTALAHCIISNRVSHRLNLNGPSYSVDTACSSSLTALNQAILNIRNNQADYCIVTGVNFMLAPSTFVAFSKAGMLSPTGTLRTFDADANGFVRGEGIGTVVLKPYDRALADGDRVYAVIEESWANQDGFTSTITAPNQDSQIKMMQSLMQGAGVGPNEIGYVEAHGTGTPIGDPIEAGAIGRVVGQPKTNGKLLIGSVKPNIGHLESGAGVNGLIKLALAIHKGKIPAQIGFDKPNPRIPLDALNMEVPLDMTDFPEVDGIRRGIVNSFGFGGANASALLATAETKPVEGVWRKPVEVASAEAPRIFPISARTEAVVKDVAAKLAVSLREGKLADTDIAEVAAALASNRTHHAYRAAIVAKDKDELLKGLDFVAGTDAEAEDPGNVYRGQAAADKKVAFMYAGQGSQWWGMARQLMEDNAAFRDAVVAYDAEFVKSAGWSIMEELLKDEADSNIDDTTVTQPALFAIQHGLVAVWKSWGVEPDMVVGHSIGEACAAYTAGGLSLAGAAKFLSKRGAIRDQLGQKGAMAAVGLDPEDIEPLLPEDGKINIAAVNGPGSTTISGDFDTLHAFVEQFEKDHPNTFIRILKVDTAWHSYQLEAGEAWFRKEVSDIDWSVPHTPWISTVTGKPETRFDIDYGWRNLRQAVLFKNGVETALRMGANVFLEMGPHTTLSAPATSTAGDAGAKVDVINSLNRKQNDHLSMAQAAARLFCSGVKLDWDAIAGEPSDFVELPGYPWALEELWMDNNEWRAMMFPESVGPLLGVQLEGAKNQWVGEVSLKSHAWIGDHRLQSECVFPGAGYMDIMFEAGRRMFGDEGCIEIENLTIHEALFIPADTDVRFFTMFVPERNAIQIYTQPRDSQEPWTLRADGQIRQNIVPPKSEFTPILKDDAGSEPVELTTLYQATSDDSVINYGPAFQTVRDFWVHDLGAGALVAVDPICEHKFEEFETHPSLLDACLQISDPRMTAASLAMDYDELTGNYESFMPVGALQLRQHRKMPKEFKVYAWQKPRIDALTGCSDFLVVDMDGNVVMEGNGLLNRSLSGTATREHPEGFAPHYAVEEYTDHKVAAPEPDAEFGTWLVLADEGTAGETLAEGLEARGAEVILMTRDEVSDEVEDMREDFADRISELMEDEENGLAGVVYAWSLSQEPITEDTPAETVAELVANDSRAVIALGSSFDELRHGENLPRVVLVTRNGRSAPDGVSMKVDGLTQAPLATLLRTVANEVGEIDMMEIDVDEAQLEAMDTLLDAILAPGAENEIVLRETGAYVPRLNRVWANELDPQDLYIPKDNTDRNFYVTMNNPGVIDNLELIECGFEELGPDDVRVAVKAVGLNFRDVMAVTGLLPKEAEGEPAWTNLGLEFGGVIVEKGSNVTEFEIGERVMGMGKRCLQRYLNTSKLALARIPEHISFEEASTIPSAFATAHYALNRVGRMAKGEKVFIHVATGGVGTAAVQMAKNVGAEIFATAGNDEKRALLKEWGVPHIMNSRDLTWADEVNRITGGKGVDVLLNSLPGAYIEKGLEAMAPYGRYLEIGKRDVYADSSIGMKVLRKNISVSVLDLAAMGVERPDLLGSMFQELTEAFVRRELEPLPLVSFKVSEVADSIRFMSQAKHVGKVVVTFDEDEYVVKADRSRDVKMEPDASYLITGGNGGFGLSIAQWMSSAGAGKLILASRSGKVGEEEQPRIEAIKAQGTEVEIISLDITNEDETAEAIAGMFADAKPLKGVMHAAAVIKDGFINQLTDEMIDSVIYPKVAGGWALEKAFAKAGQQPEFMISFSSIAATTGSPGQANYVAANGFLDALAAYRKKHKDEGGSINWGAIAATGIVGRNEDLKNYLESMGLMGLEENETPEGIKTILRTSKPNLFYANADWQQMARTNAKMAGIPRLAGMLKKKDEKSSEVRERLLSLNSDERHEELKDFVKGEIGNVLKIEPETIDPAMAMNELGLDSLSSFELKMRIETALGLTLQAAKFLQAPTILELVDVLDAELDKAKAEMEAAALAGDLDDEGDSSGAATSEELLLSDRGLALLAEATAPMTTDSAREALEHRIVVEVTPALDAEALAKAAETVSARHPVLRTRYAGGKVSFDGEGIKLVPVEALDPFQVKPVDIAEGVVASLTSAPAGEDATRLMLQVQSAVADRASAYLVMDELLNLLAGNELADPMAEDALGAELRRGIFDPEAPTNANDQSFWSYAVAGKAPAIEFKERSRAISIAALGRDHGLAVEWQGDITGSALSEADFTIGVAEALAEAFDHKGGVLLTRETDRPARLADAQAVAPLADDQPFYVPMDIDETIQRGHVDRILAAAESHDSIDLYVLRKELSHQFEGAGAAPFQISYRFDPALGALEKALIAGPVSMGGMTVHAEANGRTGIASDVELILRKSDDASLLVMRVDSDVVTANDAQRLMQALASRLGITSITSPYENQLEVAE
ncbi:SDR family NAD(P)-dependent oxidoreductase [Marinibacterium sp. SX1]|uniref:type I polyketide synthase n=1 Tax=Marinibacterium sp. SX1 TaxID=3388424 RepID=UPI003D164CE5